MKYVQNFMTIGCKYSLTDATHNIRNGQLDN